LAAVKKQLADEEYMKLAADEQQHLIGASLCDFILAGMDIQEQQ
jgi:hypothetical protein